FCQIPTFGRDTIRRFKGNVSDLKQFAAREYEDLLQCIIPMFEELLLEPHNTIVMDLLFLTAYFHGLCKLRMHTNSMLAILDKVTVEFGKALRKFEDTTCAAYHTMELPKEAAIRMQQAIRRATTSSVAPAITTSSTDTPSVPANRLTKKEFNLRTYKIHALGDYANAIRNHGTTDLYSSLIVCLHCQYCWSCRC
ncbi:hypothetical protein JAAARDRAFT_119096, partial [Jaapia argillacea MUCL 33604]